MVAKSLISFEMLLSSTWLSYCRFFLEILGDLLPALPIHQPAVDSVVLFDQQYFRIHLCCLHCYGFLQPLAMGLVHQDSVANLFE